MTLAPVSSLTFQPACHLPAGERDRAQPLLDPPLWRAGLVVTSRRHRLTRRCAPRRSRRRSLPIPRGWFLRGPSVRAHADQPGLCEV